jgi:hypothetical protein
MVELHSANVVEVTKQSKQATSFLIVPHLDLVIVATRDEQRLIWVKADTSNRTYTLFLVSRQYVVNIVNI